MHVHFSLFWEEEGFLAHCSVRQITTPPPGALVFHRSFRGTACVGQRPAQRSSRLPMCLCDAKLTCFRSPCFGFPMRIRCALMPRCRISVRIRGCICSEVGAYSGCIRVYSGCIRGVFAVHCWLGPSGWHMAPCMFILENTIRIKKSVPQRHAGVRQPKVYSPGTSSRYIILESNLEGI